MRWIRVAICAIGLGMAGAGAYGTDPDAATAAAQAACTESCQAATQAIANPGQLNPCVTSATAGDLEDVPDAFFCPGTDRQVINPYEVFHYASGAVPVLREACSIYLMLRSGRDATAVLARPGASSYAADYRRLITFGRTSASGFGNCVLARGVMNPSLESGMGAAREAAGVDLRAQGAQYCAAMAVSCASLGGTERDINGRRVCTARGFVVDPTCMRSPDMASRLMSTLDRMTSGGRACFGNGPGAAVNSAEGLSRLESHVAGPSGPKTQICCTQGACQDSVFPTLSHDRRAQADSGPLGQEFGTIRIGNSLLSQTDMGDEASRNATAGLVFHELLHRLGLCMNESHNIGGYRRRPADGNGTALVVDGSTVDPPLAAGQQALACRSPLTLTRVNSRGASVEVIPSTSVVSVASSVASRTARGYRCLPYVSTQCSPAIPMSDDYRGYGHRFADPVYACADACFPGSESASLASDTAEKADRCRRFLSRMGSMSVAPNTVYAPTAADCADLRALNERARPVEEINIMGGR